MNKQTTIIDEETKAAKPMKIVQQVPTKKQIRKESKPHHPKVFVRDMTSPLLHNTQKKI